jgi:hypothetical protein
MGPYVHSTPVRRRLLLAVAVAAVAAPLAACNGSGSAPSQPGNSATPRTSSTPASSASDGADLSAAYTAYQATVHFINDAADQLTAIGTGSDMAAQQRAAAAYRTAVLNWDTALRTIDFPASVAVQANAVLAANRVEIADLDAYPKVPSAKGEDATVQIQADDNAGFVAVDLLKSALGHPVAPAVFADDTFLLAGQQFALVHAPAGVAFLDADDSGDLSGMLAANQKQSASLLAYLTTVSGLTIPPGAAADLTSFSTTGTALSALYTKRISAASKQAMDALGSNSDLLGAFIAARNALQGDMDKAASG